MKLKKIISGVFFVTSFVSCSMKSEYSGDLPLYPNSKAIFVCNQGSSESYNATLSMYQPNSKFLSNDIFYLINGVEIGSYLSSMVINNDLAYATMTNSDIVQVFDSRTIKLVGAVKNIVKPRYVVIVNDSKGYVTSSKQNIITIFNPTTLAVIGTIDVGVTTDKILIHDGYAYVLNSDYGNKIIKINISTDKVEDVLEVAYQPNSLVLDVNRKLWVLSDGGDFTDAKREMPALTCVNLMNFSIEKVFEFADKDAAPMSLTINSANDKLMWISRIGHNTDSENGGVFAMEIMSESLPVEPLIKESDKVFKVVTVDNETDEIYVTALRSKNINGDLIRFTPTGNTIDISVVGINPNEICFRKSK